MVTKFHQAGAHRFCLGSIYLFIYLLIYLFILENIICLFSNASVLVETYMALLFFKQHYINK
jgi:TM2 domain-containing membrane protein YozV